VGGRWAAAISGSIAMFVLSKKYGRLCNRLFNAIHILALAIEHNHSFANLAFYDYAEHFQGTRNDLFCRFPIVQGASKGNKSIGIVIYYLSYILSYSLYLAARTGVSTCGFKMRTVRPLSYQENGRVEDTELTTLPIDFSKADQVIFFQGWYLRCNACVERHGDKIREYFAPADHYLPGINDFVRDCREGFDLLIGVVIRHGDYRTYLGGKYFYPLETYLNFMLQLTGLSGGKRINFLICSDEDQDTSIFQQANLNFHFRSRHMIENLYSLAACDYIVSASSTYSMWASFYGKVPLCLVEDRNQTLTSASFEVCQG
jgi:hypothetical protein